MQRQTARQRQLPFLPRGATPNLPTRPLVLSYKKPLLARPNSVDVNLTEGSALSAAGAVLASE
jgi:hypothetical protein